MQKLADLMHESTLAKLDPTRSDETARSHPACQALRNQYKALPPLAQQLHGEVRDAYKAQAKELDEIILANVAKTAILAREKLKNEFEADKARLKKQKMYPQSKRAQMEKLERACNGKASTGNGACGQG